MVSIEALVAGLLASVGSVACSGVVIHVIRQGIQRQAHAGVRLVSTFLAGIHVPCTYYFMFMGSTWMPKLGLEWLKSVVIFSAFLCMAMFAGAAYYAMRLDGKLKQYGHVCEPDPTKEVPCKLKLEVGTRAKLLGVNISLTLVAAGFIVASVFVMKAYTQPSNP